MPSHEKEDWGDPAKHLHQLPSDRNELCLALIHAFEEPSQQLLILDLIGSRRDPYDDFTFNTADGRTINAVHDLTVSTRRKVRPDSVGNNMYTPQERIAINRAALLAIGLHATNPDEEKRGRKSGEPFSTHVIDVKTILMHSGIEDCDSLVAALLHDTVEDTPITLEELQTLCGAEVARAVGYVTKIKLPNEKTTPKDNLMNHLTLSALGKFIREEETQLEDIGQELWEELANSAGEIASSRADIARFSDLPTDIQERILNYLKSFNNNEKVEAILTTLQLLSCLDSPFVEDVRAIFMKLADFTNNAESFQNHKIPDKILKKIKQGREFYIPLARLFRSRLEGIMTETCNQQESKITGESPKQNFSKASTPEEQDHYVIETTIKKTLQQSLDNEKIDTQRSRKDDEPHIIIRCPAGQEEAIQDHILAYCGNIPAQHNYRHLLQLSFAQSDNIAPLVRTFTCQYETAAVQPKDKRRKRLPNNQHSIQVHAIPAHLNFTELLFEKRERPFNGDPEEMLRAELDFIKTIYNDLTLEEFCEFLRFMNEFDVY